MHSNSKPPAPAPRRGDRHRPGYWSEYRKLHPRPRRTRDEHSPGYRAAYAQALRAARDGRPFIAIDGEGELRPERTWMAEREGLFQTSIYRLVTPQDYTLMCANDAAGKLSRSIYNMGGLSTCSVLNFLLALPRDSVVVGYYLGYDLAHWLRDVPTEILDRLIHPERRQAGYPLPRGVHWNGYILSLVGRRFSLRRKSEDRGLVVWDVGPFFQCRYVDTLTGWLPDDPDAAMIAEKKDHRDAIGQDQAEDRRYCLAECRTLAAVMAKVRAFLLGQGIDLRRWDGAGAPASALLRRHGVKERMADPPERMAIAARSAMFGGRFEHSAHGPVRRTIWEYDQSAAYPWSCATYLPCLTCGTWRHRRAGLQPEDMPTIYRVSWDIPERRRWGPFPVRTRGRDGALVFPLRGEGWFWHPEVIAALRSYPGIVVRESWSKPTSCDHRPFAFLEQLYAERSAMPRPQARVLKLAMNAISGKLAQGKGRPPFRSDVWAGLCNSGVRAQLLDMIRRAGDGNVISVATDAVHSLVRLYPGEPRFGGWSETEIDGAVLVQSGVFLPYDPSSRMTSRGLPPASLRANIEAIDFFYQRWLANRCLVTDVATGYATKRRPNRQVWGSVPVEFEQFIGIKQGMQMGDRRLIGSWLEVRQNVQFVPSSKREYSHSTFWQPAPDGLIRSWPIHADRVVIHGDTDRDWFKPTDQPDDLQPRA